MIDNKNEDLAAKAMELMSDMICKLDVFLGLFLQIGGRNSQIRAHWNVMRMAR